jgi:DNA (cytosine-5)-methyltransferase 1
MVYYNEIDKFCIEWLKNLIAAKQIPDGVIDTRPIQEVRPDDLKEFIQCHFFCGVGGWPYAAKLARWPTDKPLWTGSCPCQPFSSAGKQQGFNDPRHLWPDFFRLIRARRPACILGEQTSAKAGYAWLDRVGADLDSEDYTWRACDIPSACVNAPNIRNRIYWLAEPARELQHGRRNARKKGRIEFANRSGADGGLEHAYCALSREGWLQRSREQLRTSQDSGASDNFWRNYKLLGPDPNGKYRRVKSGVRLLAHGVSGRVGKLRGYGNAINPELAAEAMMAYLETEAERRAG